MKVTVLIPAFNEEKNIEQTLKGLDDFKNIYCRQNQIDLDILVIDDGSGDQTCINASKAGARVLGLKKNKGKGNALRAGLKNVDGDIVIFLDADLRESSGEVYKLVSPILKGEADVVIARFKPPNKKKGFGFVKALAFYGVKFFTGKEVTSALSGQRAFKKEVLDTIGIIPEGFGIEVGMLIDILKKGFVVKEVDVDMHHDVTGRDLKGFLHRGKQFWHIFKVLISKMIDYGV
ncbi:MAG TPA: glycosyltransferase family 2 protein [Thermoanaerobacterales bacterium]|nr:glycosyltransferase family 2 protein [Thermoanaerobacterales bacterium]